MSKEENLEQSVHTDRELALGQFKGYFEMGSAYVITKNLKLRKSSRPDSLEELLKMK
jgi:hypothetical protein